MGLRTPYTKKGLILIRTSLCLTLRDSLPRPLVQV